VIAQGTPAEVRRSGVAFVDQFVRGETDGPVPFHYPAAGYAADLGLAAA
jgi:phospholipid/cholesterol/gamma-HCH transport system ATP-binding protein